MQLIKVGNDYFNLDYLISAVVDPGGIVTLNFSDRDKTLTTVKAATKTTVEEWEALLVNLQSDVPELEPPSASPRPPAAPRR